MRASRRSPGGQPDSALLTLEAAANFDSIGHDWDELARKRKSIFATREWNSIWWDHYGRSRRLQLTACRATSSGNVVGILPLYETRAGPLRVLRFIGLGIADEGGPISAPESYPLMAAAFRDLRQAAVQWDVLLAERLPGDFDWSSAMDGRVVARASSPTIHMHEGDWDSYLASLGSRLRHEVRHDRRKLEREHVLQFRLVDDPSRLPSDLEMFFALHAARWPRSRFLHNRLFHEDFAARALQNGWLRLWFLDLDGQPSAAWYGFRYEGVEFHYQVGRDPTKSKESLGTVLTAHVLQQAFADGVTEYRFLRGDESYKRRFANADPSLVSVAVPRGPVGRASLAIAAFAARRGTLAARLRNALEP